MKDGSVDEMEGCDGQGHVTMEILFLQRHDVEGNCCDYLTQTHTSRSTVQRVEDGKEGGRGKKWRERVIDGETRQNWSLLRQQWRK